MNKASKQAYYLEFCSREHSLPYVRMIHNRLLLAILELNIDFTDLNCIYLIAESTIYLLKNILTKLIDHHKLVNNKLPVSLKQPKIVQKKYGKNFFYDDYDYEFEVENNDENDEDDKNEMNDLNYLKDYSLKRSNCINQFINLFELKDVLEVCWNNFFHKQVLRTQF